MRGVRCFEDSDGDTDFGSARTVSTSSSLVCTAYIVDKVNDPPRINALPVRIVAYIALKTSERSMQQFLKRARASRNGSNTASG